MGRQDNTGDLYVKGDSNSSGHITASGNIKGKTLESSGRVTVGEFL